MVTAGKGAVAAIGNFDGVHRGHRFLIAETAKIARAEMAPVGVVVFDPHPRRFFQPDAPPFLLTMPERRDALLKEAGVDIVHSVRFDAALAAMTPEAFVRDVLKARLGLSGVVAGSEFRFGKGRSGDAAGLKRLCEAEGVSAHLVEPLADASHTEKIGSSAIRAALQNGAVREAAQMLGHPWTVGGLVEKGRELGRTIGFPTANLTLGELVEPRKGVYAVRATTGGKTYGAVANFGRRPTVGDSPPLLETYLFDFSGDLYGARLDVAFADFIRDEKKFDGLDTLKAQIAKDCEEARRLLAR
ncbi:MAG: bifunctional riboflavin kinase/FAD synthetase [Pseudomonadota bacterium]|nr:bifunctional riboflavin kinase/FAD synthetase [Pseudomonadota bacterium]